MGESQIHIADKAKKHITGNFKLLHLLSWATVAAYNPFIVVYLMHNNLSTARIGVILMLNSIATLVGQPFWGMISDRIRSIKTVYLFTMLAASILIVLMPFANGGALMFVLPPVIAFFFCSMSPLLDSWTIQSIRNSGKSYGSFRLWGSIGFSIIVIINGKLISLTFVNIIFVVFGILSVLTLSMCAVFFHYRQEEVCGSNAPALSLKEMKVGRLLKNFNYTIFIFLSCITFINMTSVYSFLATLIRQVGGDDNLYGIANAISAFSEVPILLISSRLVKKYRPQVLILAGMLVYALRLFIYSIARGPELILFCQALNGLSFGMFLPGSIYYIHSLAPAELKATAQTVATAIYAGLSGIIGNVVTGNMISQFGIFSVYRTGAFIQFFVCILFLISMLIGYRPAKAET